jgi:hypothetical protein
MRITHSADRRVAPILQSTSATSNSKQETTMKHLKKNILAAALLCSFAVGAGAQNAGSTAGTTAATPSTSPVTGTTAGTTTATITTESGRTATADIPTTTAPNTGVATTGTPVTDTPTGGRHEVNKPAADTTLDTNTTADTTLDKDTRGSAVAAQAQANRGEGQGTAGAVRQANPSTQNAQSDVVASTPNFDTLDINNDGFVALSELPVGNTQLSSSFPDLDTDGDSRLTRAELDAVLTADSGEMDEDSESE